MKKKTLKKTILIVFILAILAVVGFYSFIILMSLGRQKKPFTEVPKELKTLEIEIKKESNLLGRGKFNNIDKYNLDKCKAHLKLDLYIENDTIDDSNVVIYLNTISKRVDNTLIDKKCLDSLIIRYSINNQRNSEGILITNKKSYAIK